MDGVVDEWLPAADYLMSGIQASSTRQWGVLGNKTFQVLAEDDEGVLSGWTQHTIAVGTGISGQWGVFLQNIAHTGLNSDAPSSRGDLKWSNTDAVGPGWATIDSGGIIYTSGSNYVYALNPSGTEKWNYYRSSTAFNTPGLITSDDKLLIIRWNNGDIILLSTVDGAEITTVPFPGRRTNEYFNAAPNLDLNGNLYVGSYIQAPSAEISNISIRAINPDFSLKWIKDFPVTGTYSDISNIPSAISPTIGSDGTIYFLNLDATLYALDPNDGTILWSYKGLLSADATAYSTPSLASDGTIFEVIYGGCLRAINPDGTLKWGDPCAGNLGYGSASVGVDDTVYAMDGNTLTAYYSNDGSIKWTYEFGVQMGYASTPVVASDGTVYYHGWETSKLYAIDSNGTLKWEGSAGRGSTGSNPVIADDGTVYAASYWDGIFAFGSINLAPDVPIITGTTTGDVNIDYEFGFMATDIISADSDGTYLTNIENLKIGRSSYTCALSNEGNPYCWGQGNSGVLGDDQATTDRLTPVRVHDGVATGADSDGTYLTNIKSIEGGGEFACALSNAGNTYCWGKADWGVLGENQATIDRHTPIRVHDGMATGADSDGTYLINMKSIENGYSHTCTLSNEGGVYCWGYATEGAMGDDQYKIHRFTPVRVHEGEATGVDSDGTYLTNIKSIEAGRYYTCALSNAGNTYCWGTAGAGGLGDNFSKRRVTPIRVHDGEATGADSDGTYLINIESITCGVSHTCVVSNGGNAYCWGSGLYHGQLGDDQAMDCRYTPIRVHDGVATGADSDGMYLINIESIAAGSYHTCAISNASNTYCWGDASDGRLGDNQTAIDRFTPIRVHDGVATGADSDGTYLTNMKSIEAGYDHTCAISNDDDVYCWGAGTSGKLGNNSTIDRRTPIRVHDGVAVDMSSFDNLRYGIDWDTMDGMVDEWLPAAGYLLSGIQASSTHQWDTGGDKIFQVLAEDDGVIRSGWAEHTITIDVPTPPSAPDITGPEVGDINTNYDFGFTAIDNISTDSDGTYLVNMKSIEVANLNTCALSNDDNVYCWGDGWEGQLGDDTTTDRLTPVRVHDGAATGADSDGTYLTNIKSIGASRYHTCALSNDDNVYCWGAASYGQLGDDQDSTKRLTPIHVHDGAATGADSDGTYLTNIKNIGASRYHTCALSNDDNVYCWGYANSGRLGDDQSTTDRLTPVRVHDGVATGADSDGAYLTNIKSIVVGDDRTCAISNDDNVYCWGGAWVGQLGDDQNTTDRLTPVRVHDGAATGADSDGTYLTNIKSIVIGTSHTCAISNGGNAYCWGYAVHGQLGDDQTTTNRLTPVRVHDGAATGADSDGTYLINIKSIIAGSYHTCAISNDDNVYCWGPASAGRLGDDQDTTNRLTPIHVHDGVATGADSDGTYLTNIKSINAGNLHTCAISNDNNAYCWGRVSDGQLGDDQIATNRLSPIRVHDGMAVDVFSPDNLRYGIDWNNDGDLLDAEDEWLPSVGYVLSGTTQSTTTKWSTIGDKTFQVLAEDDEGNPSDWTSHPMTISSNNLPTAGITSPDTDSYSEGVNITFTGWGSDTDGNVVAAEWRDYGGVNPLGGDCDAGTLMSTSTDFIPASETLSFSTSTLTIGDHNVCFRVKDNENAWSVVEVEHVRTVTIVSGTACSDGIDNDGDGWFDDGLVGEGENLTLADPGCYDFSEPPVYNSADNNEADGNPMCSDGIDNDGDGYMDINDAGCHSDGVTTNPNSYDKFDNDENNCGTPVGVCEIGETYQSCPTDCPFYWIEF
ncbi:MAG: PQQ-binding-like beta-propeller repeat protein [Candidatus Pacebacteria bacterium]|nr:PQQ-binding-like beta-propeller repeat protein [Candidatus Paceibacterota bacterium]